MKLCLLVLALTIVAFQKCHGSVGSSRFNEASSSFMTILFERGDFSGATEESPVTESATVSPTITRGPNSNSENLKRDNDEVQVCRRRRRSGFITDFNRHPGIINSNSLNLTFLVGDEKVELAKEFLEFVGKTTTNSKEIKKWLERFERLGGAIGLIADVISVFSGGGDAMHEELMAEFKKVHEEIAALQRDIQALSDQMKFDFEKAKIDAYLEKIKMAVHLSKVGTKEELKRHCSLHIDKEGKYDTLACYEPLKILIDKVPALMDAFYRSSQGNAPMIAYLQTQLFSLIASGELIVQNLVNELQEGYDVGKRLEDDLKSMYKACDDIVNRCHAEFKIWMDGDIRNELRRGGDQKESLDFLIDKLRPKYDWLHLAIIVYTDVWSDERHWDWGYEVLWVFHESGKNVFVFYMEKSRVPPTFTDADCDALAQTGDEDWSARSLSEKIQGQWGNRYSFRGLVVVRWGFEPVSDWWNFPEAIESCFSQKENGYRRPGFDVFAFL